MTLLTSIWQNSNVFSLKYDFKIILNVMWKIEPNIRASDLLSLLNPLWKKNARQASNFISFLLNSFNKFNKTWALMQDLYLYSSPD